MRESTKIKYIKILRAYHTIIEFFGENAPYVSKSWIVEMTILKLKENDIHVCRSVVYDALKSSPEFKKEEGYLLG